MNIKDKLLGAVGNVDISDVGVGTLVDILISRIKMQEEKIRELQLQKSQERDSLLREMERLHREIKEIRFNPMYGAHGQYCFHGRTSDSEIVLTVRAGRIEHLIDRYKGIDYLLERIEY